MKTLLAQSSALTLAIAALAPLPLMAQTASTDTTGENMFEAENDPYIWLEEARDEKALAWVEDENNRTLAALATDPRFDELQAEALAILDAQDRVPYGSFYPDGIYNFWQDETNPKGLIRRTTMDSYRTDNPVWETVLDIDALAKAEGREWAYSGRTCLEPERTLCLLSLSDGGKDATVMREFDGKTGKFVEDGFDLPESIGSASWVDRDTLLVTRDFGEGTMSESGYPLTTRLLKRGQSLSDAPEVFRGEPTDLGAGSYVLRDSDGVEHARIAYRSIDFWNSANFVEHDGKWVQLDIPSKAGLAGIVGDRLLFSTDVDWTVGGTTFPADSIVSVDLEDWKRDPNGVDYELVWAPGDRQTAQGVAVTSDALYVSVLDNVRGRVIRYERDGGKWRTKPLALPDNSTIGVISTADTSDELMINVTGFLEPSQLFYYDGSSDTLEVLKTSPARFDAGGASVVQHEATSKDGTKIPYFVVLPKGGLDKGPLPVRMTGYGGFQNANTPGYLGLTGKLWLERGGAYVLTNLRGGGEFGPSWHQNAIRENKQRTWDDFIAVAEDLQARGITTPGQLGITGGSQGGLLVGTAITQRPELFNAAVVWVPLFDMLRYPYIGRGASWIGEYGDPRIAEQRAWIEPYSPYQALLNGKDFPSPLFITSTADDRTHPSHGRKAAARLAEIGQPYYYFEDTVGGHSGGVDNAQRAKLQAIEFTYMMQRLMDQAED